MIGGIGALAVLVFVFASFLALVPLFIAAVSILTSYLALLGLTYITSISYIVEYLVALDRPRRRDPLLTFDRHAVGARSGRMDSTTTRRLSPRCALQAKRSSSAA